MLMEAQHDLDFSSMPCESLNGQTRDGFSLKTSLEFSVVQAGPILLPWLEKWLGASLTYRETAGEMPELLRDRKGLSSGQLWMRNITDWHKDADVCSLSEILEIGPVDPRYFLSPTACKGILRRADKRGKDLPEPLVLALRAVADSGQTLSAQTA